MKHIHVNLDKPDLRIMQLQDQTQVERPMYFITFGRTEGGRLETIHTYDKTQFDNYVQEFKSTGCITLPSDFNTTETIPVYHLAVSRPSTYLLRPEQDIFYDKDAEVTLRLEKDR